MKHKTHYQKSNLYRVMPICSKILSSTISTSLQNTTEDRWNLTPGFPKSGVKNKSMHLARSMWMQQMQTLYKTESQWPKDELWVFQSPGSKRTVGFCPKSFFFMTYPLSEGCSDLLLKWIQVSTYRIGLQPSDVVQHKVKHTLRKT